MTIKKDNIKNWFLPTDKMFKRFKKHTIDYNNPKKRRIFVDNNSAVLFVAHLDTVLPPKINSITKSKIHACGLDDRLGAKIAFDLAKELKADLLLTDLEESCQTTAKYHICKDYNWIVEFDRAGTDIVTYDLDNEDFLQALKKYWSIGFGSYSDICALNTQACCVNIGIGYYNAHSKDSYSIIEQTTRQIKLFKQFFAKYSDTEFLQDEKACYEDSDGFYYSKESYQAGFCEICGFVAGRELYGYTICQDCFEYAIEKLI